ncbi:fibrohexamerin-like [Bombyx mori]|uniref:Hemolymph juvenile hormone binding protein n=1 Tax=Bombyx mori TaxID=7091 RepID=A0A8R2GAP6_BOMMO|nr:fibrohexamerin-like [Bombyx mori]
MRNYLCLIFMLFSCFSCARSSSKHPDSDYDSIRRPCPSFNIDCIRSYFQHHASCVPHYEPIPDPLYLQKYSLYIANSNITVELNDVKVQGLLNAKIVEFYINKRTDKLVLAIETEKLSIDTPRLLMKYHRKAQEPIELVDKLYVGYGVVTITATIPYINNIQLTNAEVTTYAEDGNAPYTTGTNINNSPDLVVKTSYDSLLNNMPFTIREALVTQGPLFMANYIQYNICDFGLRFNSYSH